METQNIRIRLKAFDHRILDQSTNDSFVMPVKEQLQVFEDPTLHRQQRAGYYGFAELGFGVLDNRRIILGSF